MSEAHPIPLGASSACSTRAVLLYSIRAAQFVFTVITLGLTGYVVNDFIQDSTTNFGLAVSIISLFYLITVGAFTFFLPGSFIPGIFLISELVLTILWFCAFVALAADWGPVNCSSLTSNASGMVYYAYDWRRPCGSAQAAIAMAAIAWVLFVYSSFLLIWNIALPLFRTYSSSSWWERLSSRTFVVHRATGLSFSQAASFSVDLETSGLKGDSSTRNSDLEPISTEKIVGNESPAEPDVPGSEQNGVPTVTDPVTPGRDDIFINPLEPQACNLMQSNVRL